MRIKKNHLDYFFHPFEIAFAGYSNTGKTTLISKLIKELSLKYKTGYLKHDAHKFCVDYPGKDTAISRDAGATETLINDKNSYAMIADTPLEQVQTTSLLQNNDILIIEGHKYSQIPKIVFLGEGEVRDKTISEIRSGEIKNILALISPHDQFQREKANPFPEYPLFSRNDTPSIISFIEEYFQELIPKKIYGLVLSGGKSKRMLTDKGALQYFEKDQISHCANLLKPFCSEVFVSCREEQSTESFISPHKKIIDNFPSNGPSSGILSAMNKHPDAGWFVLACDLPYLQVESIKHLLKNRNPFKNATCYLNPTRGWPEPLCTLYEPKSYQKLMQFFALGKPCPRKVLFNSEINALKLMNPHDLNNVNTPDEFTQAKKYIQEKGETYAEK